MNLLILIETLTKIKSQYGNEKDISDFIFNYLKALGYNPIREELNVLVNPDAEFIVSTHIDTFRFIAPFYSDGVYAYGTGVCDAKASVCAILDALERIGQNLNFGVAFFYDEEKGGKGSEIFSEKYRPKMAVVMEPTDLAIANLHFGGIELTAKFYGKSAHGATVLYGDNAIEKCIEAINKLKKIDHITCSVQYIKGGDIDDFSVPDFCETRIEIIFKGSSAEILSKVKDIIPDAHITDVFDSFVSGKSAQILKEAVEKAGYEVRFSEMPSWTDAVNLHKSGCDVVVFGPGELHLCHTKEERVKIEDIRKASDVLVKLNEIVS